MTPLQYYKEAQARGFDPNNVRIAQISKAFTGDSAELIPNAGITPDLLIERSAPIIDVLFAPTVSDQISPIERFGGGDISKNQIQFRLRESAGSTADYGDRSALGNTRTNRNYVNREIYKYQSFQSVGVEETAVLSAGGFDAIADEEMSSALIMRKRRNEIGFYGVAGKKTYGIFNAPELLPYEVAPKNWKDATVEEIIADIGLLLANLKAQTDGNLPFGSPLQIILSPYISGILSGKVTTFGFSIWRYLRENIKGFNVADSDIIEAPEYATTGGELFVIKAKELVGTPVSNMIIPEMYRSFGWHINGAVGGTEKVQKVMASTAGIIFKRAQGYAGMIGV